MRTRVVAFFVLSVIGIGLLPSIAAAQSKSRRTNKQATSPTPATGTLKICQGVPIPDGYIVVAYRTSPSCPHGMYLLKKQDEADSVRASKPAPKTTSSPSRSVSPQSTSVAPPSTYSRPRRVSDAQADAESSGEPPMLQGALRVVERKAPKLGGLAPVATAENAVTEPVGEPAPASDVEEVGEGDVLRVETNLVTVPVSVMDRQGRFVPNLKREDFVVFDNEVEQSIAYFEPTEKPFTVALLLDTSASTRFHLSDIKEAALAFAKQLRPQDRVLIVTFSDEVLLLTEVTNDATLISAVIDQNAQPGNSTRLYDAVDLVIKERLSKIPGRKAIVLFTDGVDTSSYLATYQSTLHQVEELDALIYPIQYDTTDYMRAMQGAGGTVTIVTTTSNWPFGSRQTSQVVQNAPANNTPLPGSTQADYDRANQYLHSLADKTGARLYTANTNAELARAFSQIAEELRRQYSLGYYPQPATNASGEQRQIRVRVRQPNLAVKARNSYLRRPGKSPAP